MASNLYSLIARKLNTNEFIYLPIEDRISKENKKYADLFSIDKITTYFADQQEMVNRLYQNNYINFLNADIFIMYKENGIQKVLQPLYKEFEQINGLSQDFQSKIDIQNDRFIEYQDMIFSSLNTKEIRDYMIYLSSLDPETINLINITYQSKSIEEVRYYREKLIEKLSDYTVLREILINRSEYYNPSKKVNRLLSTEDRLNAIREMEKMNQELLTNTMNITIPLDFNSEKNKKYEDAIAFKNENQEIKEMMDLDDIIYGLNNDEALALGIDKSKIDEYVGKTR